jgi:uncharacterized membrane protein
MDNDEELRDYFDFNDADLFANRNGYLSPRQQAREKKDALSTKKMLKIVGVILLVLALLPIIILFILKAAWHTWLFWGLIWPILGVFLAFWAFRFARATSTEDTLKTVEGRVNIIKEEMEEANMHKYYDYYWNIGGVKFDVADSDKVDILQQGDMYRVYYLDLEKQILSLEKIPEKEKK